VRAFEEWLSEQQDAPVIWAYTQDSHSRTTLCKDLSVAELSELASSNGKPALFRLKKPSTLLCASIVSNLFKTHLNDVVASERAPHDSRPSQLGEPAGCGVGIERARPPLFNLGRASIPLRATKIARGIVSWTHRHFNGGTAFRFRSFGPILLDGKTVLRELSHPGTIPWEIFSLPMLALCVLGLLRTGLLAASGAKFSAVVSRVNLVPQTRVCFRNLALPRYDS